MRRFLRGDDIEPCEIATAQLRSDENAIWRPASREESEAESLRRRAGQRAAMELASRLRKSPMSAMEAIGGAITRMSPKSAGQNGGRLQSKPNGRSRVESQRAWS
jgi:hypothetical protein